MLSYYPFELHTHTLHSDGSYTPEELAHNVKKIGLSGFALTDHNTNSGCLLASSYSIKENIIFIPGIEWTTFYGHMTVLGGNYDCDYRSVNPLTIESKIRQAKEAGDLTFIAHPFRVGSPICTGCNDDFKITNYRDLSGYEVWSGPNPYSNISNKLAENKYYLLCDQGYKLMMVYGRDWHNDGKLDDLYAATYIGIDSNNINYASVLAGLKERRTYISVGLRVNIYVLGDDGKRFPIGSSIDPGTYTLVCDILPENADFSDSEIVPESLILLGNALHNIETSTVSYGYNERKIELQNGYFSVKIAGKIKGKTAELLLSTPFFVGY